MAIKCNSISLGKTNKYILLIITASFFKIVLWRLNLYFDYRDGVVYLSEIPQIIFYSLGLSLSFSLYLIYKKCNKSEKNIQSKQNNNNLVSVSKQIKKVSKIKKFLWILFIAIIDFISFLLKSIIPPGDIDDVSSWIINFIFMSLYFYFIFKIKLYKHHILSIICFGLIGIIINIIVFADISQYNKYSLKRILLRYFLTFLSVSLYCLTFVVYKFFIQETYLKSYEILYIQGLIELLLSFILITILMNYRIIYNFRYYLEYIQKVGVINFIVLIFLNFGYYSHIYIIIDIFSPFHIFLIIFIYYIIYCFIECIPTLNKQFYYPYVIALIIAVIVLFFVLVFIEIIELNCFGLSYMTKKNIELRARLDTYISNDDEKSNIEISYEGYTIELKNNKTNEIGLNIIDTNSPNDD